MLRTKASGQTSGEYKTDIREISQASVKPKINEAQRTIHSLGDGWKRVQDEKLS